jgi:hypothetical protein
MFDWRMQAEKAKSFEFASKAAVLPLMRHHKRYHMRRAFVCAGVDKRVNLDCHLKQ